METFISNRKGLKISVLVEKKENQKGLAFVMHGLGGFKEQDHIKAFSDAFVESGFTTIRFDTTNTIGKSEGKFEDATITNYYEDLEDVIAWARTQEWYEEPFFLAGHSLGGICTALFTQKNPDKVKGLAPISPVVSGKHSLEVKDEKELKEWKESGWQIKESKSVPGLIKKLKWSHMEDRLKYDLLVQAKKLTMPVLIIVGEEDDTTPPKHQQILFDAIPGDVKELHVIKDAPHTFREEKHLTEIKNIFLTWITKYN